MNNNELDRSDITNNETRQARIQTISQQIEQLSIELNDLLTLNQDDNESVAQHQPAVPVPARGLRVQAVAVPAAVQPPAFEIGQEVVILNNYQGLRGFQGRIIRLTRHQVTLRLNGQNRIVVRSRNNVRLVD